MTEEQLVKAKEIKEQIRTLAGNLKSLSKFYTGKLNLGLYVCDSGSTLHFGEQYPANIDKEFMPFITEHCTVIHQMLIAKIEKKIEKLQEEFNSL